MASRTLKLGSPPQFVASEKGGAGKVQIDDRDWARLLCLHDVLEAEMWPPAFRQGAAWLARIRQIESDCIAQFGEFDWEKLGEQAQDEYDGLIARLELLLDDGQRFSFAEVFGRAPAESLSS